MFRIFYTILLFGPSFVYLERDDTYNFYTKELPTNVDLLPTLGNGHIGFTIFSKNIYMNGVYNGKEGDSSRARIPNWANIRLDYCLTQPEHCEWNLNAKDGFFRETIKTKEFHLEHIIFAHRTFNRAIINQISVTRLTNTDDLTLSLSQNPGPIFVKQKLLYPERIDINFNESSTEVINNYVVSKKCGRTLSVEDKRYQRETRQVCVFYKDVPIKITMKRNEISTLWTHIMTLDESAEVARTEMFDLLHQQDYEILYQHKSSWNKFWSRQFDIQLSGDSKLSSAIHSSIFYLANSLPSLETHQEQTHYFGLSPNGIGRGGFHEDYWGHNFWDTEIWMFPTVNLMDRNWALQLLSYRYSVLKAAKNFAADTGYDGARFPWESAFTGREVTPEPIYSNEIHITADISFAMRQYFSMTHDYQWMISEGCDLSRNIALFFATRTSFNQSTGKYDINGVIGPDEDNKLINNNVFTNVIAGYALKFGIFTECFCSKIVKGYIWNTSETDLWFRIAENLHINYDAKINYHPQFDGYTIGTMIKQADTVLLGFPLEYSKMNESTRANDLNIYENVTRSTGPAMTWSMHAINHLDLKHNVEAARLLDKSYSSYVRAPFNVWCEYTSEACGAVNFITGAGGFLQAILYGYAGIRPRLDHLLIKQPVELPGITQYKIHGLEYLRTRFRVNFDEHHSFIHFYEINPNGPIIIVESLGTKYVACLNCSYTIYEEGLKMYPEINDPIDQCLLL